MRSSLSTKDMRKQFTEVISRVACRKERIILTQHGKRIAAIVPVKDAELLDRLEDRVDLDDARAALADVRRRGTVSWRSLKAELGL